MTLKLEDSPDIVWNFQDEEGFSESRIDSSNLERLPPSLMEKYKPFAKSNCKACYGRGKVVLQTPAGRATEFTRGMIPRERERLCDCVMRRLFRGAKRHDG